MQLFEQVLTQLEDFDYYCHYDLPALTNDSEFVWLTLDVRDLIFYNLLSAASELYILMLLSVACKRRGIGGSIFVVPYHTTFRIAAEFSHNFP